MPQKAKKLVAVSTTSMSMTEKKTEEELKQVPCICYSVTFKDQTEVLIGLRSEVNAMNQAFGSQLGFKIQKTNIGAQKIERTTLEIYKIVVSIFSVLDNDDMGRFFEKSFLLADVKSDIVLGIPFPTINNADVDFQAQDS